ncbi:MAG: hypothetical protein CBB70_02140 [Planctomycetaceae bacterium TMED10]|jgi:hypothetical protein|nr:MAG: hypothetical protein CBB70_02140 [Planctomycetaceae bacterium TMED10]
MNYERGLLAFLLVLLIICCLISTKTQARNDYLGTSYSSCERGRVELYTELRGTDGKDIYQDGDGNPDNNYTSYDDDVNGTIGLRFSWPLQSTCNNETIELMQENDKLRQELELLANCAKYKDLELGPEFATVREMCKGVNKKAENAE